jgi:hypothetical protein
MLDFALYCSTYTATLSVGGASPSGESIPGLVQYNQSLPLQEYRFDDLIHSSSNASSI